MSIDSFQLDDTLRQDFTVQDPATGAISDADADPDIEVYEDGGSAPMHTTTAAKRDAGTTGQYSFSVALTAANGFEVGKTYNVYALAAVGGTDGGAVVSTFRIQTQIVYAN